MNKTTSGIIYTVIIGIIVAGVFQALAPPLPPLVVGIDLGTTFSCVAVFQNGIGTVKAIVDKETSKPLTPSVVSFFANGSHSVGYAAQRNQILHPSQTVFDSKRFLGLNYSEIEHIDLPHYPFVVKKGPNDSVLFSLSPTHDVSPQQVGALILQKLKADANHYFSGGRTIKGAVVGVPVEFNEDRRRGVIEAGKIAGVNILRLINEPTAAAIAYGLHLVSEKDLESGGGGKNIIVFDFGGGTLDVSLLTIQDNVFETLAVAGDEYLGGEDINLAMYNHYAQHIGVQFFEGTDGIHLQNKQNLLNEVERVKIELSTNLEVGLHLELLLSTNNQEERKNVKLKLTRTQLNEMTNEVLSKVLAPIESVLEQTGFQPNEIDEIILVGGSTRIPRVRETLKSYFNKEPNTNVEPEQAVALGAAIQAGILMDSWPVPVAAVEKLYVPKSDRRSRK